KDPVAQKAVRVLAAKADIFVENYRPGVTKRLGISYPMLKELNPRLVYCSISGFGQTGPSAELAAYAPAIHAGSGYDMAHMSYQPGRTQPDNCGVYIADVLTGTYAFGGIMAALNQRNRTGEGQHVDVSMLESMLTLTLTEIQASQFTLPPAPSRHQFSPVAVKDGYIHIAVASERTFQGLCEAAGHPEWVTDPRFEKYLDRRRNWAHLMDEFEAWSRTLPGAEVLARLEQCNVPSSPYRTVKEVLADPQIAHREALSEVHDRGGTFKALNPPFRLSGSATRAGEHAAALGEHSAEVLKEAGLSDAETRQLLGKVKG
ncbi:MAG: CoA transferase, partial [Proteobacteria bacterium]|nr:CoA transferase [Pseudomonadota bacterium]